MKKYIKIVSFETMYGCAGCIFGSDTGCTAPDELSTEFDCGNANSKALRIVDCLTEEDLERGLR